MISHSLLKKIVGVVVWRLDGLILLVKGWCPLAGVATDESVEILKA
jgi:hypothetical protein